MITLTVNGTPKPQGSKVLGRRRDGSAFMRESNKGHKTWRDTLVDAMRALQADMITGPTYARLEFNTPQLKKSRPYPITRSSYDIDKLSRTVLDALTISGLIADDSQIVTLHSSKRYSETPGVTITIRGYE